MTHSCDPLSLVIKLLSPAITLLLEIFSHLYSHRWPFLYSRWFFSRSLMGVSLKIRAWSDPYEIISKSFGLKSSLGFGYFESISIFLTWFLVLGEWVDWVLNFSFLLKKQKKISSDYVHIYVWFFFLFANFFLDSFL